MNRAIIFSSIFVVFFVKFIQAQDDIQVGSQNSNRTSTGGLYDYSDPTGINFRVQLWGYVKFPGFYIVPAGTSLNELISLGGGPLEDALLNEIRVVKMKEGSQTTMLRYNYNDLVWENRITIQINYTRLDAGDIVVIPGEPRYFVREDIAFYLGVVTTLATLALLIITIYNTSN